LHMGEKTGEAEDAGRRTPGEEPEAPAANKPTGADEGDKEPGGQGGYLICFPSREAGRLLDGIPSGDPARAK
jgi:hypothetical protein